MDFAEVERRASPGIAQRLQSNDYFNKRISGREQEIDGERLDDLTRGAVILGVETVNYPLTDGLYIYMRRPAGDVIALLIETSTAAEYSGLCDVLRISKATIA